MGDFPAAHSDSVTEALPKKHLYRSIGFLYLTSVFLWAYSQRASSTRPSKLMQRIFFFVVFFFLFLLELHNKTQEKKRKKRSCMGHGSRVGWWNSLLLQMKIDLTWLRRKCSRTKWCFIHVTFSHVTYFLPLTPVLIFLLLLFFFLSAATLLMLSAGKHELLELCCLFTPVKIVCAKLFFSPLCRQKPVSCRKRPNDNTVEANCGQVVTIKIKIWQISPHKRGKFQ